MTIKNQSRSFVALLALLVVMISTAACGKNGNPTGPTGTGGNGGSGGITGVTAIKKVTIYTDEDGEIGKGGTVKLLCNLHFRIEYSLNSAAIASGATYDNVRAAISIYTYPPNSTKPNTVGNTGEEQTSPEPGVLIVTYRNVNGLLNQPTPFTTPMFKVFIDWYANPNVSSPGNSLSEQLYDDWKLNWVPR